MSSARRECLDRMLASGEQHLPLVLSEYAVQQDGLRGEVLLPVSGARAFSAQPSSEPSGTLSMHWALR